MLRLRPAFRSALQPPSNRVASLQSPCPCLRSCTAWRRLAWLQRMRLLQSCPPHALARPALLAGAAHWKTRGCDIIGRRLRTGEHDLAAHKDEKHDLRLLHAVDEPGEQLRLILRGPHSGPSARARSARPHAACQQPAATSARQDGAPADRRTGEATDVPRGPCPSAFILDDTSAGGSGGGAPPPPPPPGAHRAEHAVQLGKALQADGEADVAG
jgi:hypothetical protein